MKEVKNLKAVTLAVIILNGILLLGAIAFYKQRMLFIDASHILFRIINLRTFQIADDRYGSFVTQIIPLLGVKLHLSLNKLLLLYSISFNLFFFYRHSVSCKKV